MQGACDTTFYIIAVYFGSVGIRKTRYAIKAGLLADLAKGHIIEDMKSVLSMTDKLKADLPHMLEEHKQIVQALDKFADIAKKLKRMEYVEFAENLKLHAKTEEEVMYPAAILVGEYLKLKLH